MNNSTYWVERLQLVPHPEGGFFKETYRSPEVIPKKALPRRFLGDRAFSTSIYFLLDKDNVSAFHRIQQDEVWHFYDGTALILHIIGPDAAYATRTLGKDADAGQAPQIIVKAGCFFAAELENKESYALTGCTVAPGFDFEDFDMPDRERLIALFPRHADIIKRFTR
jgi:uncharacterized protein